MLDFKTFFIKRQIRVYYLSMISLIRLPVYYESSRHEQQ